VTGVTHYGMGRLVTEQASPKIQAVTLNMAQEWEQPSVCSDTAN